MQRYQRLITGLYKSRSFVKPNSCSVRFFTSEKTEDENQVSKKEEQVLKTEEQVLENEEQVLKNEEQVLKNEEQGEKKVELSGFAKAFEKFATPVPEEPEKVETFAHLIRHSKIVDLGDPDGKLVAGKIFHIVGDDLYIDFGGKFHCVCQRPVKNGDDYVRGANVRLRIKDLELSTKFIGATKDLTILEADCTLMGLFGTPVRKGKSAE